MHALALSLALLVAAEPGDKPFSPDKGLHFVVGLSVGAASHSLARAYAPDLDPLLASIVSTSVIGLGKEAVDALGFGTPSGLDVLWTVAGGLVGLAVSVVVQALFATFHT